MYPRLWEMLGASFRSCTTSSAMQVRCAFRLIMPKLCAYVQVWIVVRVVSPKAGKNASMNPHPLPQVLPGCCCLSAPVIRDAPLLHM